MAKTRVNGKKKKRNKGKKKAKAVQSDPQATLRLLRASGHGKVADVLALLGSGVSVDAANYEGITPLISAAFTGNVAMLKLLIEHKASIDKAANDGTTTLFAACQIGHDASAKLLIDHKASIDKAMNNGVTPLQIACLNGHGASVELLIEHKASVNKAANDGFTPLHAACQNGHDASMELLIDHKASVDKALNDGATTLHYACMNGHDASAKLLIEHKASIDNANNNGFTPLFIACQYGHDASVELLIEHKASIDKAANNGDTPLHTACRYGHDASAKLLIEHKASVDTVDRNSFTPLFVTCTNSGHASIVKLLLEHGAQANYNILGVMTSLAAAIHCGHVECVKTLLRVGSAYLKGLDLTEERLCRLRSPSHADIAAFLRDTHGFSPLHFACEQRRPALLRALLRSSHGAKMCALLGRDPTAIDRATAKPKIDEAQLRATALPTFLVSADLAAPVCRVRVSSRGSSAGWVCGVPETDDGTWVVALDDGEKVNVDVADLERVAVPSLLEVSNDERFGRVTPSLPNSPPTRFVALTRARMLFATTPSLVCSRTRAMVCRATLRWSPSTHHFFPVRFRRAAVAMLCVRHALNTRERVGADARMAVMTRDMPLLGAWLEVLSMCPRDWFEVADGAVPSGVAGIVADVETENELWCEWCGRPSTATWSPRACTGCHAVYYCDSRCNRANWGEHKAFCKAQRQQQQQRVPVNDE